MEKLITKITDNDFGLKFGDMEKPQLRKGARGIVIREDGKIAIFNKANKHEYKLPGGGIEENENPEDAFWIAFQLKAFFKSINLDVRMSLGFGDKTYKTKKITENSVIFFILILQVHHQTNPHLFFFFSSKVLKYSVLHSSNVL